VIKERLNVHVVPGWILSKNDSEKHFISAPTLALLYELRPGEWFECAPTFCRFPHLCHLGPRYDGNYVRPSA
jgi:hypothetical protein